MPEFRENNIPNHGEKKPFGEKIKEKANFVTPVEKKIKRYAVRWSKEQKLTVKWCNATITNSAQYKSRANYRNPDFCDIYIYIKKGVWWL